MRGVSIFCLGMVGEVGLDSKWVGAGYKTLSVPSYDLDTPSDALENQIGPLVWPLQCFEVSNPNLKKWKFGKAQILVLGHLLD